MRFTSFVFKVTMHQLPHLVHTCLIHTHTTNTKKYMIVCLPTSHSSETCVRMQGLKPSLNCHNGNHDRLDSAVLVKPSCTAKDKDCTVQPVS